MVDGGREGRESAACLYRSRSAGLPTRSTLHALRSTLHLHPESRIRLDEPLGKKTTFGVGGTADIWMEIGSVADLARVVKHANKRKIPFRLLGSDGGARGITARLKGGEFGGIRIEDERVVAGAGVPLARLLAALERRGLAGLEFLEGIPGTVGGAVRMNAGAWGGEIGNHVEWIRCVDAGGGIRRRRRPSFGYRSGPAEIAIVEVSLAVRRGAAGAIRAARARIAAKRTWMKGLHCAGSVFKNPAGDYAGRLIEKCGLKGAPAGGATISRRHANVIVASKGARASDVLALMEQARMAVKEKFGIELENEVQVIE